MVVLHANLVVEDVSMKSVMLFLVVCITWLSSIAATPQVKNVTAMQQYPWGKVYITYEVVGNVAASATKGQTVFLWVQATDKTSGIKGVATSLTDLPNFHSYLSGDVGMESGLHKIVWDIGAQGISLNSTNVAFSIKYSDEVYIVVDLSSGNNATSYPVSYLYAVPSGGWTDEYKTTKLVLRRIEPGVFMMGGSTSTTISKAFYMGIFEVTQKQYQLVIGSNPSEYQNDMRPVEKVSFDTIRGQSIGQNSFIGKLRTRAGLNFDLPTEAQWEYACRAGTTSDYNNGGSSENDLKKLGRYSDNQSDGKGGYSQHTKVGSYQPNAWNLHDMHGNVLEWCLNVGWEGCRVIRGGSWVNSAWRCTSSQWANEPSSREYNHLGFRLLLTLQ